MLQARSQEQRLIEDLGLNCSNEGTSNSVSQDSPSVPDSGREMSLYAADHSFDKDKARRKQSFYEQLPQRLASSVSYD